jgi:hypothetical protein
MMIRVQEQDNNANGYLVWFKRYLDSINSSHGIYKWCLDQLTSDILQMVLMKMAYVQEMALIDKSNKWIHTRKFFQVVSHSYTWYSFTWYLHVVSCKTMVSQVILNFK